MDLAVAPYHEQMASKRWILVGLAVATVTACSKSPNDAIADLDMSDSPREVLAVSVLRPPGSLKFASPQHLADTFAVYLGSIGYNKADTKCGVDRVLSELGPEADRLTFGDFQDFAFFHPEILATAKAACASPDSLSRLDKKSPAGATGSDKKVDRVAPDLAVEVVRSSYAATFRLTAQRSSLNETEVNCVVDTLVTQRSDEQLLGIVHGTNSYRTTDPANQFSDCVTDDRLAAIIHDVAVQTIADKAANKAEHDRKQAELSQRMSGTSTTSTP